MSCPYDTSHDGNFGEGERAMAKIKILQEGQSYTFRSYFELPYEADDILAEFDYSLARAELSLPKTTKQLDRLPELKQKIRTVLPFISLSNETAPKRNISISNYVGGDLLLPMPNAN